MPARNEAARIAQVLEALARQSFQDFRVVVYDNASQDDTVRIARRFEGRMELRVCTRSVNLGQTENINRSFQNADADLIALLSANDTISDIYLESLVAILDSDPHAAVAYARAILVDDEDVPTHPQPEGWDFFSADQEDPVERACTVIERYCQGTQFNALYRRTALDRMRPQPFCYGGDHVFAAEASIYGKVICAERAVVRRGIPPDSASPAQRMRHLMNLFSLDYERGLPVQSKLMAFDQHAPHVDMIFGHIDMFRHAQLELAERGRLVLRGIDALCRRFAQSLDKEIAQIASLAERAAQAAAGGDPLSRLLAHHALRKVDQCLFLSRRPALIEARRALEKVYLPAAESEAGAVS